MGWMEESLGQMDQRTPVQRRRAARLKFSWDRLFNRQWRMWRYRQWRYYYIYSWRFRVLDIWWWWRRQWLCLQGWWQVWWDPLAVAAIAVNAANAANDDLHWRWVERLRETRAAATPQP